MPRPRACTRGGTPLRSSSWEGGATSPRLDFPWRCCGEGGYLPRKYLLRRGGSPATPWMALLLRCSEERTLIIVD